MLTPLMGTETEQDKAVIAALEGRFRKAVAHFEPIRQQTTEVDGYWYIRMHGEFSVMFIRVNCMGEMHLYDPGAHEVLNALPVA